MGIKNGNSHQRRASTSTSIPGLKAIHWSHNLNRVQDSACTSVQILHGRWVNAYGYTLINNKQFDKAVAAFKLNAERHPESPNAWDSLGEGYALAGDKPNAIANFKKSLSLNPPANVKANSEKYLKQLGAM